MSAPRAKMHLLGGAGPAVVFLHGFGSDRYSWAANAPMLMDVAQVWAADLPGHGAAGNAVGAGDAATLAQAVLESWPLNIGTSVLVGHSLGGAVAAHLAQAAPHLVRHLVLIAPAGLGAQLNLDFITDFAQLTTPEAAQTLLQQLVERKRLIAPAMVAHVLTALQDDVRRGALGQIAHALRQMPRLDLRAALPDLPIDVIWGEADAINTAPMDDLGATTLLRLPNTGHMPQIEAASRVNSVIRTAVGLA